jgi:hypothetical protein
MTFLPPVMSMIAEAGRAAARLGATRFFTSW